MRSAVLLALFLAAGCDPTSSTDAGIDAPSLDVPMLDVPGLDATTDAPITADTPATIDAPIAADVPATDAPTACSIDLDVIRANRVDLLFTSESDYPIVVEVFAGEGAAAPTEADVVRLAMPEAGSTTAVENVDRWWPHVVVDPTVAPPVPDTRPAELRAAVEAELTDLTYVRVTEPSNPYQIQVFLVGRACGDLVWLRSTSVET